MDRYVSHCVAVGLGVVPQEKVNHDRVQRLGDGSRWLTRCLQALDLATHELCEAFVMVGVISRESRIIALQQLGCNFHAYLDSPNRAAANLDLQLISWLEIRVSVESIEQRARVFEHSQVCQHLWYPGDDASKISIAIHSVDR